MVSGTRGYYVTDDWVAGSRLMGLSSSHIVRLQDTNLLAADEVLAVSPDLATVVARRLEALDRSGPVTVLPNGCYPARLANASEKCDDVAGLVGKLNERLDLSLLEAVVAAGIRLRIIGPRRDRDPDFGVRLSALLSNDKVEWLGEVGSDELPDLLGGIKVGLTPYDTGPFNRSSFPLKTLEYLAAGLPVVSTPIPAVGWLNTDMIVTATLPAEFAQRTLELIESPIDHDQVTARIAFARQHSWTCRAQSLMNTLGIVDGGDRTKVVS
jgi:teichuronic acid biosynthesis glycosyltransferase TuaH